tara:strand:+ start:40 stop:654 length:615 start_codon:yes stop_codon:yes gene_type:complete
MDNMIIHNDLLFKLKKLIPPKISDLNLNIKNIGFMRFDNDLFDSVYVRCTPLNNCTSIILKFSYINNDFVFAYIYIMYDENVCDVNNPLSIINPNFKFTNEFRYDSELNLDCTYLHYSRAHFKTLKEKSDTKLYNKDGTKVKICEKDGKAYWYSKKQKNFSKYFNFLKSKKFIDNCFGINKCNYLSREDCDSTYLTIGVWKDEK